MIKIINFNIKDYVKYNYKLIINDKNFNMISLLKQK